MSLAVDAARSATWMLGATLVAKFVALLGTLLIVRYVSADEYGEAVVAAIVVQTAALISQLGIGQYVLVKVGERRDLAFHATMVEFALGAMAAMLAMLFREPLGGLVNAPGMVRYLPIMVASLLIDRVSLIPERVLMREMRFRQVAFARSMGEFTYGAASLTLAIFGWGGMAIAIANVGRAGVRAALILPFVDRRDWLEPCRLRLEVVWQMLRFGVPLALGALAGFVATKWDNLLVSSFFGPAVMAAYNVAYNLSGMVSGLVTEQIVDILVPSLSRVEAQRREKPLLRAMSLLALVAMPLSLGLAAVAPTVVATVFRHPWPHVAEMLAVLSAVTALGPFVVICLIYFQVSDRTTVVMTVQGVTAVSILGCVAIIGRFGPLWTCAAVGLGALIATATTVAFMRSLSGLSVTRLLATQIGPLVASGVMIGAVLVVRRLLADAGLVAGILTLPIEVVAGAVAYVATALVVARQTALDTLSLFLKAFRRRSASATETTPSEN